MSNHAFDEISKAGQKKMTFNDLLWEIHKCYSGEKKKWLRCLLYDHLPISDLSSKSVSGITLFNKLKRHGCISPDNVKLLLEIVKLTKIDSAIKYAQCYIRQNKCNTKTETKLEPSRKGLFKALIEVEQCEVYDVAAFYEMEDDNFTNIWDLVFEMEKRKHLDTIRNMKRFANHLNPTAKDKLLGSLDVPVGLPAVTDHGEPSTSSSTSDRYFSEQCMYFTTDQHERMDNEEFQEEKLYSREKRNKKIKECLQLLSVKNDSLFVGRDNELTRIIEAFDAQTGKCCCVVLVGPPGVGKTKLSINICAIFPAYLETVVVNRYFANLRNLMSVNEVGAVIMHAIGFKETSPSTFNIDDLLQWIRTTTLTETIIYLDNADDVLRPKRPSRDDFINFLRELLQECNQRVKFLITTRYRIDNEVLMSLNNFHQLDVKPLQVLDAMSLLRRSSAQRLDYKICKNLVFLCGHNPHAIRALASRLKQGQIEPKELLELLDKPVAARRLFDHRYQTSISADGQEIQRQEGVIKCLRVIFNQLDNTCKKYLIMLSIFPSFFNRDVAAVILGQDKSTTSLYLQELFIYGVLEFEKLDQFKNISSGTGNYNQYNIHTLMRITCTIATDEDSSLKPLIDTAMTEFLKYYHDVINTVCEMASKNFRKGLEQYQNDKINLLQYLEHEANIQSMTTATKLDFCKEDRRYVIFDGLVEADRRVEYFEIKSRKAMENGDWISYIFFCAWLGDQYICQAQVLEAHKATDNGLNAFNKLKSGDRDHKNAMVAKAACLYVKGRAYTGQQKYNKSLETLKKSLALRREYEGNHTMTARVLNAIGHVFYRQDKIRESHDYHEQAWDMITEITDGKPEVHLDASVYVMNLGACFRSWGNQNMDAKETEKGHEQYNKAMEWFNTALKMQQESFPGLEIELTSKILKNRALCYFEMEKYQEALADAKQSLHISQRILKENPDTARCLYFVGTIHHHIGKKILKTVDVSEDERADAHIHFSLAMESLEKGYIMEHSLGPHRRSIDFGNLKEEIKDVLNSMAKDEDATIRWEQRFAETKKQDGTEDFKMCYEEFAPPRAASRVDDGAQTESYGHSITKKLKLENCYIA